MFTVEVRVGKDWSGQADGRTKKIAAQRAARGVYERLQTLAAKRRTRIRQPSNSMHGMNPAEFANIARCERDFWWYRGMRAILFRILEPHLAGRKIGRVLEAGCGTGYLSACCRPSGIGPWCPWTSAPTACAMRARMGVERPVQGDTCQLPFAAGAFDLVLSMDVLAHLPAGAEAAGGAGNGARAGAGRPAGRARRGARHSAQPPFGVRLRTPAVHAPPPDRDWWPARACASCAAPMPIRCCCRWRWRNSASGSRSCAGRPPAEWNPWRPGWTGCCTRPWRWRRPGSPAAQFSGRPVAGADRGEDG